MLKSIYDISLAEILPPSIAKDAQIYAIAKSLDQHLHKLAFDAKVVLHYPRLEELDHEVLDLLAEQFNLVYYEPTEMSLEMKRDLIRNSIHDHRIRGTAAAVENLLRKIVGKAEVVEWYEYGGRPYYFRVKLSELKDFGDEGQTFIRLINATKNARSWLDDLIFDLSKKPAPDETLHVGQLELQQGNIKIGSVNRFNVKQNLHVIQSTITRGKQTFSLDIHNTKSNLKVRAGFITHTHGRIRFDADIERDDLFDKLFEKYLRKRWEEFKNNAVVKHYTGDDGELDIDDVEYFPVQSDFLRLYWRFENSKQVRYTTHYHVKDDLQAAEILTASSAGEGVLMHSKLKRPTSGVIRAFYVKRTEEKVI